MRAARLLSEEFTGEITIEANEGGVRRFTVVERWDGRRLLSEEQQRKDAA